MAQNRPSISIGDGDAARLLDAAVRQRSSVMLVDLFLSETLRLTEWQRVTVQALLAKLVSTVEDEVRASLASAPEVKAHAALHAALSSAQVPIAAPILEEFGLLRDAELVGALVRRSEEHRRFRTGAAEQGILPGLVRSRDETVAGAAMTLLIAQSRRFDRFADPVMARTELAADLEHRLAWRVGAALRHYLVGLHEVEPALADRLVVGAVGRLLAGYDEGETLEARAVHLAQLLSARNLITDALIENALGEGNLPFFLAGLSVRLALDYNAVWDILSDPQGRGAVLLLRAADIARAQAASILLTLAASGDLFPAAAEDVVGTQLDHYDVTSPGEAIEALRLWKLDPAYREAIGHLAPVATA